MKVYRLTIDGIYDSDSGYDSDGVYEKHRIEEALDRGSTGLRKHWTEEVPD